MSDDHHILVRGKARRYVRPDRARWSIEVMVVSEDKEQAFATCSRQTRALMEALRTAVGSDGEVATEHVRTAPHWDSRRACYAGFRASTTVLASSTVERAGAVAGAASAQSVHSIDGPTHLFTNQEQVETELLASALEAAREKAETLAAAAGRKLGRVVSVRESGVGSDPDKGGYSFTMEDRAADPEIAAKRRQVSAEVDVGFEFSD